MLTPTQIRQLRQERGWSQQALADRLGVNRTTVVRWEAGEVKAISALAGLLEKTLEIKEEQ
jgi:ribosome-binding protein aMBF1 (putative translation factor)